MSNDLFDFEPIESPVSHTENLANWAQDSPSGTVVEFSNPHVYNDGTYGFDSYEYDVTGTQINRTDGHQLNGVGQQSLLDYEEYDPLPLISGKLDQQTQTQFGGVDTLQQDLNQF